MKSFSPSKFSKIMMVSLGAVATVLIVTTCLERNGLCLMFPEFNLLGCALMLAAALVWGAVCFFRRLKSRNVRLVVGLLLGFVIMFVSMFMYIYIMQFGQLALPHKYGMFRSPEGKVVVIMHSTDMGLGSDEAFDEMMARMNERKAYAESQNPELETVGTEDYPNAAYGYMYAAFPVKMGIFYDSRANVDGLIFRGSESQSAIRYEWQGEDAVRLYLENPEPGDSGEVLLKY